MKENINNDDGVYIIGPSFSLLNEVGEDEGQFFKAVIKADWNSKIQFGFKCGSFQNIVITRPARITTTLK